MVPMQGLLDPDLLDFLLHTPPGPHSPRLPFDLNSPPPLGQASPQRQRRHPQGARNLAQGSAELSLLGSLLAAGQVERSRELLFLSEIGNEVRPQPTTGRRRPRASSPPPAVGGAERAREQEEARKRRREKRGEMRVDSMEAEMVVLWAGKMVA